MIASRMNAVLIRTSTAGARPLLLIFGIRRWETIDFSTLASWTRICFYWCGGKTAMMRLMVSVASRVWSVEKTRWPVSAASSAVSMVSKSRISPTRMTSGSCRRALRSACVNELVSTPISRWLMIDRFLDGHDVRGAGGIDVIDHCRQCRRFAAAGRAGHEHQPALFRRDLLQYLRQRQLVDGGDAHRDHAEDHPDRAALLKRVAAEPAETGHAVGEIDLVVVLELLAVAGREDRGGHRHHILVIEPFLFGGRSQRAADPHHRVAAHLQVEVRGAALNGNFQEVIDVHALIIGLLRFLM